MGCSTCLSIEKDCSSLDEWVEVFTWVGKACITCFTLMSFHSIDLYVLFKCYEWRNNWRDIGCNLIRNGSLFRIRLNRSIMQDWKWFMNLLLGWKCWKERNTQEVQKRTGSALNVSVSSLFAWASKLLSGENAFWDPSAWADNGWAIVNILLDVVAQANLAEARANKVLDASARANFSSLERTWCCL